MTVIIVVVVLHGVLLGSIRFVFLCYFPLLRAQVYLTRDYFVIKMNLCATSQARSLRVPPFARYSCTVLAFL